MAPKQWISRFAGLALIALAMLGVSISGAAEPDSVVPSMQVDRITATDTDGRALGTLVLPSIVNENQANRPLLVVFNGGPGAASAWLQLGLLGPWQMGPDGALVANHDGLWDKADILFVDPLGTGFSRARADAPASVLTRDGDGAYLARAIVTWMDLHHRSTAAVVLIGESYGAERAVTVAAAWARGHAPVRLSAIALLSQTVLSSFALDRMVTGGPLPANLPTMAATACYWNRRAPPLACAQTAEHSTTGTELAAIGGAQFARLATRPSGMTLGLFRHLFHAPQDEVLGLYDSRQSGPAPAGHPDPALASLLPRVTEAARRGCRLTMGYDRSPLDDSAYVLYDAAIRDAWRYPANPVHDPALAADLSWVLRRSGARLLVAGGVFDTVSSYAADRRLVAGLGLPTNRITLQSYPAGHMFYFDPDCRRAFLASLRRLIPTIAG